MEPALNNALRDTLNIFLHFLCVNAATFLVRNVLCPLLVALPVKNLTFLTQLQKHAPKDVLSQQLKILPLIFVLKLLQTAMFPINLKVMSV